MKKAFTLVEMLIVVVVLVTLMTITFRLSSIGDEQTRRNTTVNRMQRIENCLSGYYAAFGTYPPVKLHGSRDYNQKVNRHGFQTGDNNQLKLLWYQDTGKKGIGTTDEQNDWRQVHAACRSQPFAARFPFPEGYNDVILARAELAKETLDSSASEDTMAVVNAGYDDGYTSNPGRHDLNEIDWTESQLFQFGLMSFLLPRYLIMMNGDQQFFRDGKQWQANNSLPARPLGSGEKFSSWWDLKQEVTRAMNGDKEALAEVKYIPSQAVCARWLPNLEQTCHCEDREYEKICYGIDIHYPYSEGLNTEGNCNIFSPGGSSSDSTAQQYVLDMITIVDGWSNEFYYYSPKPYQSYTVWSAGPNGRTFPPWASRDDFTSKQNMAIGVWIDDDIIHMNH